MSIQQDSEAQRVITFNVRAAQEIRPPYHVSAEIPGSTEVSKAFNIEVRQPSGSLQSLISAMDWQGDQELDIIMYPQPDMHCSVSLRAHSKLGSFGVWQYRGLVLLQKPNTVPLKEDKGFYKKF